MKWTLAKREHRMILIAGCLTLGIGWVYAAYVVGPLIRNGAQLKGQVLAARQKFTTLQAALGNEASVRQQYRQAQEKVKALRSFLPTQGELSAVIGRLSDLASQTQVSIQSIFPQRPVGDEASRTDAGAGKGKSAAAQPAVYEEVVIQINALAGYHQLGAFLSLVESGKQPIRLANLHLSPDPRDTQRHHVDVLVRSYFATAEATLDEGPPAVSSGGEKP